MICSLPLARKLHGFGATFGLDMQLMESARRGAFFSLPVGIRWISTGNNNRKQGKEMAIRHGYTRPKVP